MMPAMRAAPSTSPFLALPESTRSSVSADRTTRPCATATRSVAGFCDTSTMRASPPVPIWVSLPGLISGLFHLSPHARRGRRRRRRILCQQRPRGGGDVVLPHQALADQEGGHADLAEAGEVGGREDAAFTDQDAIARDSRREQLGHCGGCP